MRPACALLLVVLVVGAPPLPPSLPPAPQLYSLSLRGGDAANHTTGRRYAYDSGGRGLAHFQAKNATLASALPRAVRAPVLLRAGLRRADAGLAEDYARLLHSQRDESCRNVPERGVLPPSPAAGLVAGPRLVHLVRAPQQQPHLRRPLPRHEPAHGRRAG